MTPQETNEFHALLDAWRSHQDNRVQGATIPELKASRDHLDEVRTYAKANLSLAS